MTIEQVYELDETIRAFVLWVKERAEINRNDWKFVRTLMQDHVGWNRAAEPTDSTLDLYTCEAFNAVLREIYPYID